MNELLKLHVIVAHIAASPKLEFCPSHSLQLDVKSEQQSVSRDTIVPWACRIASTLTLNEVRTVNLASFEMAREDHDCSRTRLNGTNLVSDETQVVLNDLVVGIFSEQQAYAGVS
jgi:hypothetical protein